MFIIGDKDEAENELQITRGDTGYLNVTINGYEPAEGDTLTLTVRKSISDAEPKLTITVPVGEAIVILPEHTKSWDYGKYFYDIQLDTVLNEVFTIIEKSPFRVTEEVTR